MNNLFKVYDLLDIEPVKAQGMRLWDRNGIEYLDFYGGHAVISIGHCHPVYVEKIEKQLHRIGFYSNAVINPLQEELAASLCHTAGTSDYNLFLCNSGAEANENALKLASFFTGRDKVLAFKGAFHGRTSAAVAVTDNPNIQAPVNKHHRVTFIPFNDMGAVRKELLKEEYAAVIVEGIQGVGGIHVPEKAFMEQLRVCCDKSGTVMIIDEVQSGYGRTGKFFAHQHSAVKPDIITVAKGMGNGFPIAGMLVTGGIEAKKGMLGTTFGGNHLACSAALAVLDVINGEHLLNNASEVGSYLIHELQGINGVTDVRGMGLMIGVDVNVPQSEFRKQLVEKHHIISGYSGQNTLRLLPPLTVSRKDADEFLNAFRQVMHLAQD